MISMDKRSSLLSAENQYPTQTKKTFLKFNLTLVEMFQNFFTNPQWEYKFGDHGGLYHKTFYGHYYERVATGSHLHPCLVFTGKGSSLPSETTLGRLHTRIVYKKLQKTNTLVSEVILHKT